MIDRAVYYGPYEAHFKCLADILFCVDVKIDPERQIHVLIFQILQRIRVCRFGISIDTSNHKLRHRAKQEMQFPRVEA
jgi:hypothetical protein